VCTGWQHCVVIIGGRGGGGQEDEANWAREAARLTGRRRGQHVEMDIGMFLVYYRNFPIIFPEIFKENS